MSRPLGTRRLPPYLTAPGCRKAAFDTQQAAQERIQHIRAKVARRKTRRRQVLPSRAYQCPDCGMWHLTSKPARAGAGEGIV